MHQLLGEGLTAEGFVFDTALAAYLLAPTDGSYAMDKLAISYFNTELPEGLGGAGGVGTSGRPGARPRGAVGLDGDGGRPV